MLVTEYDVPALSYTVAGITTSTETTSIPCIATETVVPVGVDGILEGLALVRIWKRRSR